MTTTDPTQARCPEGPRGDNATHHLAPKRVPGVSNVMACIYCGQTEAQLREHDGLVFRTRDELRAVLQERFGEKPDAWAFQCPRCGDIATTGDFRQAILDAGREGYASELLGQVCIGRVAGALTEGTYDGRGCDWTASGLFSGPEYVIFPDGREVPSFPVAPKPVD